MAFLVFLYWITLIASLISIVCPSQTFKQSDISSSKLADHDNLNSITIDNELKGSEFTIHYVSWLFHPNQPYSIPTTSPSQSSIPLNIISHVDDDPYQIVWKDIMRVQPAVFAGFNPQLVILCLKEALSCFGYDGRRNAFAPNRVVTFEF
jgi:hypothetical protein